MIIEFEINKRNTELIGFFKKRRWSVSEIIREVEEDKVFVSKNTLHYDNFDQLLEQTIILPDGTYLSSRKNVKEFSRQVKSAQKRGIELEGGYTPSYELIDTVKEALALGSFVLRIIGDDSKINEMQLILLPIVKFNQKFFLRESTEIRFTHLE